MQQVPLTDLFLLIESFHWRPAKWKFFARISCKVNELSL